MKPINARALVIAVLLGLTVFSSGHPAAAAQTDNGSDLYVRRRPPIVPIEPSEVAGVSAQRDTRVLGRTVTRSAGNAPMPITGGDVAGLTALGLGAIAAGTILVRRGRRTT